jgi:hypothetical protein
VADILDVPPKRHPSMPLLFLIFPPFGERKMNAIDLNTAGVGILTQLPGISKDIAYRIVNHRKRHGWFTAWEELLEVKDFPAKRLVEIKSRATLSCPDEPGSCTPPRHLEKHLIEAKKKPEGYTRSIRTTRRPEKMRTDTGPRHL